MQPRLVENYAEYNKNLHTKVLSPNWTTQSPYIGYFFFYTSASYLLVSSTIHKLYKYEQNMQNKNSIKTAYQIIIKLPALFANVKKKLKL